MDKRNKKNPKRKINPSTSKTPKIEDNNHPGTTDHFFPVWRFGLIDFHGSYGWECVNDIETFKYIHDKLTNFELMKWSQIKQNKNNHYVRIERFSKAAKKRLKELEYDDIDQLFSLRLNEENRIWGKLTNEIYYIIWWDAKHGVCPSKKKHT